MNLSEELSPAFVSEPEKSERSASTRFKAGSSTIGENELSDEKYEEVCNARSSGPVDVGNANGSNSVDGMLVGAGCSSI
jgi:hypothetical protein